MNVKELRLALRGLPDDLEVVLSIDTEGNGFSPLSEVEIGKYLPYNSWSGDWLDGEEYGIYPYSDEEQQAICLWPSN